MMASLDMYISPPHFGGEFYEGGRKEEVMGNDSRSWSGSTGWEWGGPFQRCIQFFQEKKQSLGLFVILPWLARKKQCTHGATSTICNVLLEVHLLFVSWTWKSIKTKKHKSTIKSWKSQRVNTAAGEKYIVCEMSDESDPKVIPNEPKTCVYVLNSGEFYRKYIFN
jgi:hypothetical protein